MSSMRAPACRPRSASRSSTCSCAAAARWTAAGSRAAGWAWRSHASWSRRTAATSTWCPRETAAISASRCRAVRRVRWPTPRNDSVVRIGRFCYEKRLGTMGTENAKVLLVDDDKDLLQLIAMRLTAAGYAVTAVESGQAALAALAVSRPQVVVTDLRMQGMDGMALFDAIHRDSPSLPLLILTAHGTIPEAVTATRRVVFSFLTKPFEPKVLLDTVADAMRLSSPTLGDMEEWRAELITRASAMEDLLAQARRVAASDASVCIFGASGTGKELLARAIHRASPRGEAPFVAVNCGAIPEGLLESELFGHKKGSFTGAVADRRGLFQAAQAGTLFLDEIGDMPLPLQVKLLRALEERKVRPVGSHESHDIDVRVIAATHRKLEERIASGEFREDLYYRLNVVKLYIPGLAERREDIPLLTNHFLARLGERYRKGRLALAPEAMQML